jgi:hypothetical protein
MRQRRAARHVALLCGVEPRDLRAALRLRGSVMSGERLSGDEHADA